MLPTRLRVLLLALPLLAAALSAPAPASAQAPTELLLSEYVEGSSLNKAVEIFNGTGAAIDLSLGGYQLEVYFNGSTSPSTFNLVGTIGPGDVFVFADDGADPAILAVTDQITTSSLWNGNDAIVLRKAGTVIDSLGQVGNDPGAQWGTGDASTQDNTIRRKASVCTGDTDPSDAFDPATEWDGFPNNTFGGLGAHSVSCAPPAAPWVINEIHADPSATAGDANGDGTI
jgi:predicted extracellular nuclease